MHSLNDLEQLEDSAGRIRAGWRCECGKRGSGATPTSAIQGFKRHVRGALRREQ